jgi:hypothetical protein
VWWAEVCEFGHIEVKEANTFAGWLSRRVGQLAYFGMTALSAMFACLLNPSDLGCWH